MSILLCCALAFVFAPNDPFQVNLSQRLIKANTQYPLGTDTMGRCVLSRLMYGGRETIALVIVGGITMAIIGSVFGVLMGYFQDRFYWIGEAFLYAFTAFPPMVYLIIFVSTMGSGIFTTMMALILSNIVRVIKLVKTKTEQEKSKAYVYCAEASGASKMRIAFRHILPNLLGEIAVYVSLTCADMILLTTSFAFVGIAMMGSGVVDWGTMIADASTVAAIRPELMIYPAIGIFICTFVFNMLGEETN